MTPFEARSLNVSMLGAVATWAGVVVNGLVVATAFAVQQRQFDRERKARVAAEVAAVDVATVEVRMLYRSLHKFISEMEASGSVIPSSKRLVTARGMMRAREQTLTFWTARAPADSAVVYLLVSSGERAEEVKTLMERMLREPRDREALMTQLVNVYAGGEAVMEHVSRIRSRYRLPPIPAPDQRAADFTG